MRKYFKIQRITNSSKNVWQLWSRNNYLPLPWCITMEEKESNGPKKAVNSYRMRPSLEEMFKASKLKDLIQKTLVEKLQGKSYNAVDAGKWTREISDAVSAKVKDAVEMPRYKHVVQVTLGQQLGAGCRYIAKCCWDAESDSQVSDVFSNASLFCVCTVFGVYLY